MNKTIHPSLQDSLLRQLDKLAEEESRSRSEVMREAARMYIERKRQWAGVFAFWEKARSSRGRESRALR